MKRAALPAKHPTHGEAEQRPSASTVEANQEEISQVAAVMPSDVVSDGFSKFAAASPCTTAVGSPSDTLAQQQQPGAVSVPGISFSTTQQESPSSSRELNSSSNRDREIDLVESGGLEQAVERNEGSSSSTNQLVQAQLVPPTVMAVSVVIDEDVDVVTGGGYSDRNDPNSGTDEEYCRVPKWARWCPRWQYSVLITTIASILISVAISQIIDSKGSDDSGSNQVQGTPDDDEPPTLPPQFDYLCYSSTKDLLKAQINDYMQTNSTADVYVICPNTTISIGVLKNPAAGDYTFTNGDYPLWVLNANTTIQCGLDGSVENACVMDGGFVQYMAQDRIPLDDDELEDSLLNFGLQLDNVTIRGMTFTGIMGTVGPLDGSSVIMSQPGHITFVDCWWTELVATGGLISVHKNDFQKLLGYNFTSRSALLTIRESRFENIVLDRPLLLASDQSLEVDGCTFANISVSEIPLFSCTYEVSEEITVTMEGGCANLMTCLNESTCSIARSCIHNMETTGPSLVYMATSDNLLSYAANQMADTNGNYMDSATRDGLPCEYAVGDDGGITCWGRGVFEATTCLANS